MKNDSKIRINKELHEKLNSYLKLINKEREGNKIKQPDVVNKLLDDFFEGKVLTNTFIELDQPFYFNMNTLTKQKYVEATEIQPIKDLSNVAILHKIPVNLDEFNKEHGTYCFNGNPELHRGIYTLHTCIIDETIISRVENTFLVFQYDIKKNSLEISSVDAKDLDLYIDDPEVLNSLFDEIKEFESKVNLDDVANVDAIFESMEVMEMFSFRKRLLKSVIKTEIESYLEENPDSSLKIKDIDLSELEDYFTNIYNNYIELKNYKEYVYNLTEDVLMKVKELEQKKLDDLSEEVRSKYGYSIDDFELIE